MSAILYGNLSVEIVNPNGARVDRVRLRQAAADLLRPRRPDAPASSVMLGRKQEMQGALRALRAARPIGFHADCGFGKTTLLREIAATASERGIGAAGVYVRAGTDGAGDLFQRLVTTLYTSDQPVKLTPDECARLLGQVSRVIAIDDVSLGPRQVGGILDALSRCAVVIGSSRPVLGARGDSVALQGLPPETAIELLARDLGRPLTAAELPAARRLATAAGGQPLHLRQAAALVRDGRHSVQNLARVAGRDPEALDRLSINALAEHERRALAVLAVAAGALMPANVVAVIGQVAYVAETLDSLHRRGLAEQRADRFGLPVCKAASYRQILLRDIRLAAAARDLGGWLAAGGASGRDAQSAADAAVCILEYAAERGDWISVARLARAAEAILFTAGRWEAWHHVLGRGLEAAKAAGDTAAEAFFAHQRGTLAFCQDQLDDARDMLHRALRMRESIGDRDGAEMTRHNLRLLEPADGPAGRAGRKLQRTRLALAAVAGAGALAITAAAISGGVFGGGSAFNPARGPSSTVTTQMSSGAVSGQPSASSSSTAQVTDSGGTPRLNPAALPAGTVGIRYSQPITAAGGAGPYAFAVSAGALPPGLSLSSAGVLSGDPTAAGSYQVTVQATDSSAAHRTGTQAYTLQIVPAITLAPATLRFGTVGVRYSQPITAAGGAGPYAFAVSAGALPPGLSLSSAGVLSGDPTAAGSYQVTVQATDSSAAHRTGTHAYTVEIMLALSPATLPGALCGTGYEQAITASGGTPPYSFSVSAGTLPNGLSLSSAGALRWGRTTAGTYHFTVQATDSSAAPRTGSQAYTLTVGCLQ